MPLPSSDSSSSITHRKTKRDRDRVEKTFGLPREPNQINMSVCPFGFGSRSAYDPLTSFDLWEPFASMFPSETSAFVNARVDWKETPEAHVLKADLPGLKKEHVRVEVEDGHVLQISGERSKEKEDKNDRWHRVERSSGKFVRRFRLPENAKMDQVKATMEDGVLTVTVPKAEVKKPEVKSIEISG
ncbi:uncharacterized protein A4U43_C08F35840 [Asparagus officinalis]|uniref:18.1 kDa class I heat shock protein-like n=1 Tax=Asparagus officinalis TaxID=4686 RepID=UPI00098E189B|nr:18.1 kDa class I heat shock protein-like [Asparagus officinalis]ONK62007.1 uncharacterized protein A4U43_C08F35840 [Asparagus officinalis]